MMRCLLLSLFTFQCFFSSDLLFAQTDIYLENTKVKFTFTVNNNLKLKTIENKVDGFTFDFYTDPDMHLWEIEVNASASNLESVDPTDATSFSHMLRNLSGYQVLSAYWNDTPIPNTSKQLNRVAVTIRLDDNDSFASMKMDILSDPANAPYPYLERAHFPKLHMKPIGVLQEDDFFTFPRFGGYIIGDPILNAPNAIDCYPAWYSMQFFSYYDQDGLLLFRTNDLEGHAKYYNFKGLDSDDQFYWSLIHIPEANATNRLTCQMPYQFIIGPMKGDWYDAAMVYRDWAVGSITTRKVMGAEPTGDPDDFPSVLLDIDGVCGININQGNLTDDVLNGITSMKNKLSVDQVVHILYEWWDIDGYLPDPWPYVTAKQNLAAQIDKVHNNLNDLIFPFTWNSWNILVPSIPGSGKAVIKKNGHPLTQAPDNMEGEFYIMDPYLQEWQDFVKTRNVIWANTLDVDGIYWDCWSGENMLDYSNLHGMSNGHSDHGGNYSAQGRREMALEARSAVRQLPGHEDWFMASEYPMEFLVDVQEMAMWNYDQWNSDYLQMELTRVPMYEAVYGDRQILWTLAQTGVIPDANLNTFACYLHASKLSIGETLGFNTDCTHTDHWQASGAAGDDSYGFLKKLLNYSTTVNGKEIFLKARNARNVRDVSVSATDYESLYSVFPQHLNSPWNKNVRSHKIFTPSYPLISNVIPSVWKTYNGSFAIVLINWTPNSEQITYSFDLGDYGIQNGYPFHFLEMQENGSMDFIKNFMNNITETLTVDGRGIRVFVVKDPLLPEPL